MNDWISRERLNKAIEYEYDGVCVYDVSGTQVISDFQDIVDRQPAVDVSPVVHARWILIQNGSGICSACNRNDHIDSLAAYCRYCGAKMDEKGE